MNLQNLVLAPIDLDILIERIALRFSDIILEKTFLPNEADTQLIYSHASVRLSNCLRSAEVDFNTTISEMSKTPAIEISRYRNFGKKSICELRDIFNQHGINW